MRELALMVRQQIGKSGLYGNLPGGVVLTGGGSVLPGTASQFEEVMPGHKIRGGEPKLSGPKGDFVNNPAMAAVVGLALFVARSYDDELSPVAGAGDWKDRIRTFWSLLSGRA
jgi:cell division protein FtsA